jgi:hypothetical protein
MSGAQAAAPCSAARPSHRLATMHRASPCAMRESFHAQLRSPMTTPMRENLQLSLDECSGLEAGAS